MSNPINVIAASAASAGELAGRSLPPSPAVRAEAPVKAQAAELPVSRSDVREAEPRRQELEQAVESVRRQVESKAPGELVFSIDQDTGRALVKIVDKTTGETIRQIPPKEMLEIAKSIEKMQGMLLHQKA